MGEQATEMMLCKLLGRGKLLTGDNLLRMMAFSTTTTAIVRTKKILSHIFSTLFTLPLFDLRHNYTFFHSLDRKKKYGKEMRHQMIQNLYKFKYLIFFVHPGSLFVPGRTHSQRKHRNLFLMIKRRKKRGRINKRSGKLFVFLCVYVCVCVLCFWHLAIQKDKKQISQFSYGVFYYFG